MKFMVSYESEKEAKKGIIFVCSAFFGNSKFERLSFSLLNLFCLKFYSLKQPTLSTEVLDKQDRMKIVLRFSCFCLFQP